MLKAARTLPMERIFESDMSKQLAQLRKKCTDIKPEKLTVCVET